MMYKDINIDFIKRTKELLNELSAVTDKEVTLLINLCLGLINVPSEKHAKSLPNIKLKEILSSPDDWGINERSIKIPNKLKSTATLQYFVRRLRNGISHFNIAAQGDENNIKNLIIEDKDPKKKYKVVFKIELTVDELKKFVIKLADSINNI